MFNKVTICKAKIPRLDQEIDLFLFISKLYFLIRKNVPSSGRDGLKIGEDKKNGKFYASKPLISFRSFRPFLHLSDSRHHFSKGINHFQTASDFLANLDQIA